MNKTIASASVLLSLLGALPVAAQAQPVVDPTYTVSSVAGPAINFGAVAVGSNAKTSVGGTNNTGYILTVYAALGGTDAGEFSVTNGCSGIPLNPGASCSGTIGFAPRSAGPKKAELIIVMRGVQALLFDPCVTKALDSACYKGPSMEAPGQLLYTQTHALSGIGQ